MTSVIIIPVNTLVTRSAVNYLIKEEELKDFIIKWLNIFEVCKFNAVIFLFFIIISILIIVEHHACKQPSIDVAKVTKICPGSQKEVIMHKRPAGKSSENNSSKCSNKRRREL